MKGKRISYVAFYRIYLLVFLLLFALGVFLQWGRSPLFFLLCAVGLLAGVVGLVLSAVGENDPRSTKWIFFWVALVLLPPLLCLGVPLFFR